MRALAELALLVAVARCPTSSSAEAAVAWRDAASRWEERAQVCLVHLRAAHHDQVLGELAKQPEVAQVRRPWAWWAGGVAGGLALGVAAASCVERPCQPLGLLGAVALAAVAVGLTVAF